MSRIVAGLLAAAYGAEECQEDSPLMQVQDFKSPLFHLDPQHVSLTQTDSHLQATLYQLARDHQAPLSSEIRDILQVIEQQVESLLALNQKSHAEDQGEMARAFGAIALCNDAAQDGSAKVTAAQTSATAMGETHATCRAAEATSHSSTVASCDSFKHLVSAKSSDSALDCIKALPTSFPEGYPLKTTPAVSEAEAFLSCMQRLQDWSSELATAQEKNAACSSAYDAYKAQVTQCRKDQEQFELQYCLYKQQADEVCSELDTCYETTSKEAAATCSAIQAEVASRKSQANAGAKIKCLASTLLSGQFSANLSECDNLPDESAGLDIACPAAAEKLACHLVESQPGDEAWSAAVYGGQPWISEATNEVGSGAGILGDVLACSPTAATATA